MTQTLFIEVVSEEKDARAKGDLHAEFGHRVSSTTDTIDDGVYAGWSFRNGRLHLWNDRYGMYPCFYAIEERGGASVLRVSNCLLRLLAEGVDPEPDHEARSAFLRFGFYLGHDTPFARIKALPPRASVGLDDGRWSITGSYTPAPPRDWTEERAIEAFIEGVRGAIGRRPCDPAQTVMPLTAGRDSRHIILELARQDAAPAHTLTANPYPALRDTESEAAAEVARHVGAEHETVERSSSLIDLDEVRNLRTDLLTDEGTWAEILRPRLKDLAPSFAYDGIAGNGLAESKKSGARHARLFAQGRYEELAEVLVRQHEVPDESIEPFIPEDHRDAYDRSRVVERTAALLKECRGEANPVERWYARSRTRREVILCSTRIFDFVPTTYAPFLDHELYDNLASVPALDLARFGDIHSKAIARGYPEAADLAYGRPGAGQRISGKAAEMADALCRLMIYAARCRPARAPRVALWTAQRLADRRAEKTMPRRFLQYMIQLEHIDRAAQNPEDIRSLLERFE
ncbi:MAG: hypothetical protein JJU33_02640 [Phycisphaerales bacterium]|nr:hypothetical protein [Phycisphaerales bacterium]